MSLSHIRPYRHRQISPEIRGRRKPHAASAVRLRKETPRIYPGECHDQSPDAVRNVWTSDAIAAGSHGNPASVIGFTPKGGTDVAILGGNYGRIIRPRPQAETLARSHVREIHDKDLKNVIGRFRDAGFSVSNASGRMVAPPRNMRDLYADPGYARERRNAAQ